MAGPLTRMLVLGVIVLFEPLNGYQIRRELLSWGVQDWAALKPGSIYSMLRTLERQGKVRRWDLPESDTRSVAVYLTTDPGRSDFAALVRGGLDGSLGTDHTTFTTAMSFLPLSTRAEALTALGRRQERLATQVAELVAHVQDNGSLLPPHVGHLLGLDHRLRESEQAWLADFIDLVRGGALSFADEGATPWVVPPEDAGWEMLEQSKRYRSQIEGLPSPRASP